MKFAQITCVYPPYKGGIATSARDFARVLQSAGEVKTFTMKNVGTGRRPVYAGEEVVYLKAFPGLGKGGFLPQLFFSLKNFDRIILHYPFFGTAEIIWFLKKFFWKDKKKLFIHYHMDVELPSLLLKILSLPSVLVFNSLFKQADIITCASLDYVKNGKLKNIYKEYSNKFFEIPFGVDIEKFKPLDYFKNNKNFTILFVGGLDKAHYFKGVNILLEAVAKIEECKLNIVGSGDMEEEYKNKTKQLGIAVRVNFLGNVSDSDLPKKYQEADCLVLPSINKGEAFGIVLLEAMASGLPVVASDLSGVRLVFENGKQGLLVKPGDQNDLSKKIKYLAENPVICKKMAQEARILIENKYSKEKINKKLIDLYLTN